MFCMGNKLKVYKLEDGIPAVKCPRCDEMITPSSEQGLFDGHDCPECGQIIQEEELVTYFKILNTYEEDFQ